MRVTKKKKKKSLPRSLQCKKQVQSRPPRLVNPQKGIKDLMTPSVQVMAKLKGERGSKSDLQM